MRKSNKTSGATCKGVLQLEATFIVRKHVSPPGLEPGFLEYRSNELRLAIAKIYWQPLSSLSTVLETILDS